MGGVAVAHHVRRDMAGAAHAHCPRLQAFLDLTLPQPTAVFIGEQGLLALFGNTHRQIIAQCRNAFAHQRHLPLLAAFTIYADPAFVLDDTVQIQPLYLAQAQTAAIHQFKHGLIAHVQFVINRRMVENMV